MLFSATAILPIPNMSFSAISGSPYGLNKNAKIKAVTPKDVSPLRKEAIAPNIIRPEMIFNIHVPTPSKKVRKKVTIVKSKSYRKK